MTISQETIRRQIGPQWWRAWRDRAETVLAELLEIPAAYIVLEFELPVHIRHCWACTWPGLARDSQPVIGDRWRGDGPGMILDTSALEQHLAGSFVENVTDCLQEMAWGTVAHEAGHWLEVLAVDLVRTRPAGQLETDRRFPEIANLLSMRTDEPGWSCLHAPLVDAAEIFADLSSAPPRHRDRLAVEHGPRFCWNALHVLHRLQARGVDACLVSCIDYETFGLPRPAHVLRAVIGAELSECVLRPLAEVAVIEIPPGFLGLFERQCKRIVTMTDLSEFFAGLKAAGTATIDTMQEQWEALVLAVANGTPPEAADAQATLTELGKTPAELQRAVQNVLARRRLVATVSEAAQALAEIPELERRQRNAETAFAEAERAHEATMNPIVARLAHVRQMRVAATRANEELARLAKDTAPAKRAAERSQEIDRLNRRVLILSDELDDLRSELRKVSTEMPPHEANQAENARRAKQLEAELIPAKMGEIQDANATVARLNAASAADQALMLAADLID